MAEMYRNLEIAGVDTADDAYRPSFVHEAGGPSSLHLGSRGPTPIFVAPSSQWASGPVDPAGRVAAVFVASPWRVRLEEDVCRILKTPLASQGPRSRRRRLAERAGAWERTQLRIGRSDCSGRAQRSRRGRTQRIFAARAL